MARGGKRPNAGRKKGAQSEATKRRKEIADKAMAEGLTPLEFMLNVMREPKPKRKPGEDAALFLLRYAAWEDKAFEAAKAAAPYVHPKLAAVEHTGKDGNDLPPVELVLTPQIKAAFDELEPEGDS